MAKKDPQKKAYEKRLGLYENGKPFREAREK